MQNKKQEISNTTNNNHDEERELYEHYRFQADKGQGLLRLDKYLSAKIESTSRNRIQNAAKAGNILVNGIGAKPNYKVKPNDVVTIVLAYPPREIELIPQNIPINVIYEDNHIIVVNKEPGMVVHPGYGNYTGTLVNALVHHFKDLPLQNGEKVKPGLVHRIDKNTSGILLIAKNEYTQTRLAKIFFDRKIDRLYQALVWGDLKNDSGTISNNIGRSLKNRKIMQVYPDVSSGKHAITHYKVIERFGYVTLIECKLETGRTHQIRIHLKHINHPLFNDETYGGDKILKGTTFTKYKQFINNCFKLCPRHALHAKTLAFNHPVSGNYISFEAPLPTDMQQLVQKWRQYSSHKSPHNE